MKLFNIKYAVAALALATITISCDDDDDVTGFPATTDFSGTFVQEDQMGRPGINTVFTPTEDDENEFNVTLPANGIANFQAIFQDRLEAYYDAYGAEYENNILGLDIATLTTVLALDVLQVAPNADTSYFNPNTGVPLTGRRLTDDVIDVSLILLFGGESGARFDGGEGNGDDDDDDDSNNVPNLVSDNVGVEDDAVQNTFPYLTPADF
ncbi:DUF4331 family protein [Nonlabens ponticola]|uniref:DUF4331 domain-containing protein n=1 Tax=Nonlabens ponticola TaxID=2496866 RepID=A0A3S9MYL3_9FLAO|nr:DUF4331 family protein [Nonlabens ponticola]AZQ44143.1 DUF4331 domain-containing protein [Nonlabens ponticola]